jgi:hypothetical protein
MKSRLHRREGHPRGAYRSTRISPRRVTALASAGLLLLALASAAGASSPAPRASSPPTPEVVRYQISFAVSASATGMTNAGGGIWTSKQDWSGSWPNVSLRIVNGPGNRPSLIYGLSRKGTIQASESFGWNDPPNIYQPTNCMGEVPTQTYHAVLFINAEQGASADTFDASTGSSTTPGLFTKAIGGVIDARCADKDGPRLTAQPDTFSFTAPDGIKFDDLNPELLDLYWFVPFGRNRFPISELLAGRSFRLESGTHSAQTSQLIGGTTTEAASVKFKFLGRSGGGHSNPGSGGRAACRVPALHGVTLAAARRKLKAADCRLGKVRATTAHPPPTAQITAQTPKAGAIRPAGSRVNVTVGG